VNKDCSLKQGAKKFYLMEGDLVHTSGYTMREIRAATTPETGRTERAQAMIDYCFPLWEEMERENEIERKRAADQSEADDRWQCWTRYGPPRLYAEREQDDFDVGTPEEEQAFEAVIAFDCSSRSTLAILGKPGTRKTQLISLWLRQEILENGKRGQFITARDLIRDAKSVELMKRYTTVDRLVIDDLGSDANDVEVVLWVVDARLNNKLPTAYTSNAAPKQLREIYGARGFSRLMCNAEVVILGGRDWRLRLDTAAGS
jgi:DNA replication protein DnaC